jgi:hypothetical protein
MATEKYTALSSGCCAIHDAGAVSLDLVLPDGGSLRSLPPRVSLAEMIQRSRQLRQWFPSGLRSPAERWQAKTDSVFRL